MQDETRKIAATIHANKIVVTSAKGNLDQQANKDIYDFLINGGVDGLVVMGSTGEFFSMQDAQKKELIDLVVNHVNHRNKGVECLF
jgi:dihydrodipicolinate synthase/N-acetylneuraminate lyase